MRTRLLVLLCLVSASWALTPQRLVIEPPIRVDLKPPEETMRMSTRNVFVDYMTMPIDHFDPQNSDTYQMRFMYNEEFFGGDGSPIFIIVGGEWDITSGWLVTGNMFEMAKENKGFMVSTEHRYYGQSLPYTTFTAQTLRFLNVDQALADLAFFISNLKEQPRFASSKVVLYGGSYAANMALWFKQRYPHLAIGVVASSGPIKGEVNFTGYLKVVHDSFESEGGEQCIGKIRQGINDTIAAMQTEAGRRTLEAAYRLCNPLDYNNEFEMGYFAGLISWTFSGDVQNSRPGTLQQVCNNFNNNVYGQTPMQSIGGYLAASRGLSASNCWGLSYASYLAQYRVPRSNSIAWYYQTCTEYGFFQTAPTSGTVFDPLTWLSVEFYVDLCKQIFDQRFDSDYVYDAVERVNEVFGGLNPDVNNTINVHGTIDPWHYLGVNDRDLKDNSPTMVVPRASHCFDLQPWRSTDTIKMTNSQQRIKRIVASWL